MVVVSFGGATKHCTGHRPKVQQCLICHQASENGKEHRVLARDGQQTDSGHDDIAESEDGEDAQGEERGQHVNDESKSENFEKFTFVAFTADRGANTREDGAGTTIAVVTWHLSHDGLWWLLDEEWSVL